MKKIVIHKAGGYEQLKIEEHPTPYPKAHEVLVRILAVGVNYADVVIRWGLYSSAKEFVGWPITPGFEFSGVVEAIGREVQDVAIGQKVMGVSLFGAYATHICVSPHQIFPMPTGFSEMEAAGFPAVFLTAYHVLFQNIVIRKNMKILVHAASGGVGSALLQLGKIAQCQSVGVVGASHKIQNAYEMGADDVIDKSKQNLWIEVEKKYPEGFDIVCDANGVSTLMESYKHLAPTGKLICYGFHSMLPKQRGQNKGKINFVKLLWNYIRTPRFNPLRMTNDNKSLVTFNLSYLFNRHDLMKEAMDDLLCWCDENKIKPLPVKSFPLEDVSSAHRSLESGQTIGKLILVP